MFSELKCFDLLIFNKQFTYVLKAPADKKKCLAVVKVMIYIINSPDRRWPQATSEGFNDMGKT